MSNTTTKSLVWTQGIPEWVSSEAVAIDQEIARELVCWQCRYRGRMAFVPRYCERPRRFTVELRCRCGAVDTI